MFGDKLKALREARGMTQESLAAEINLELTRQSVSNWERTASYPDVEKLLAIAVLFNVSLDELFEDELAYMRKDGSDWERFKEKYPGIITGVETLIKILDTYDKREKEN